MFTKRDLRMRKNHADLWIALGTWNDDEHTLDDLY